MNKENNRHILHGEVFYQNQWMPIAQKIQLEKKRRQKIEQGVVLYQGEWIPIAEKVARTKPATPPPQQQPQQVVINQTTINRQTYDQRTFHEHRHVHVDQETLAGYQQPRLSPDHQIPRQENGGYIPHATAIPNAQIIEEPPRINRIADNSQTHYLPDNRNTVESTPPPPAPEKKTPPPVTLQPVEETMHIHDISDEDVNEFLG